jgi:hypothetical protein
MYVYIYTYIHICTYIYKYICIYIYDLLKYHHHYYRLCSPLSATPVKSDTDTWDMKITDLTEYTFITQSFFMCWRALHLGIYIHKHTYLCDYISMNRHIHLYMYVYIHICKDLTKGKYSYIYIYIYTHI